MTISMQLKEQFCLILSLDGFVMMSGGTYVDGRNGWSVLKLKGGNLPAYLKMQLGRHYGWK